MKSILLSIVFYAFLGFSLFGQNSIYKEILGRPTNNSIIVRAIFDDTVEVKISYGTTSGSYTNQTSWQIFNPDTIGEAIVTININSLIPNTKYFYQLSFRYPGSSIITNRPEYSFQTARSVGESFTFTVEADPHLDSGSDTALYRVC